MGGSGHRIRNEQKGHSGHEVSLFFSAHVRGLQISQPVNLGERNPTSTKGRSRWKLSSENYLVIAEVRLGLGIQKPFSTRTTFGGCRIASSDSVSQCELLY